MKKWILSLLMIPFVLHLFAQQKIYEEPVGWASNNIELHTIADKGGQLHCLFLMNEDSVRAVVMDKSRSVLQHFFFPRVHGEDFKGGFVRENTIYAFFQKGSGSADLHCWKWNIVNAAGEEHLISLGMKHERAVGQISCGDHFLFFSVNRKASEFALYDFRDEQRCDTMHYQFPAGVWEALTTEHGIGKREIDFSEIDPEGECSTALARSPNKLYWLKDTLFLLMNQSEKGVTKVFSFDIANKKTSTRKIVHNNAAVTVNPEYGLYVDNSMLLDDRLYFVSAEPEKLSLQVRDFHSGELLREFMVRSEEEIPFKNTAIIREDGAFSKPDGRKPLKTSQLISRMTDDGEALIVATREDSGRIGLTIGSYKIKGSGSGIPVVGGLGALGAVGALISAASVGAHFARNNWSGSARFLTVLDSASAKHLPGDVNTTLEERIELYTANIAIPPGAENLFRNNSRYVYAYYDRAEHKLAMVDF
jgi:hypothetical protein